MDASIFFVVVPALMTPCDADGRPDLDALARRGRQLVEAGMSAVVYCGSMGDWPLLDDATRRRGVEALVGAGVPVVVGTGAVSTAAAAALARHAEEVGAQGLMVIPRLLSRGPSEAAQRAHFAAVLRAARTLPAVIYNSPYYGFRTRAGLFGDLRARHPNLVGFKEFGGPDDMRYAGEAITSAGDGAALIVGVDTGVVHGFVECGAVGAITGIGNVLPREVLHLVALCRKAQAGDVAARRRARELDDAMRVLASFDEGPDLVLYYKHLMTVLGHEEYRHHFNRDDALSASQRGYAEAQLALFQAWYDAWSAEPAAA